MSRATATSSWVRSRRFRKNFMLLLKNIFFCFLKNYGYITVVKMIKNMANIIKKNAKWRNGKIDEGQKSLL